MTDGDVRFLNSSKDLLEENLTSTNFKRKFQFLLHSEEHQMEIDIRNYDMKEAKMSLFNGLLALSVPGLAENRPSVLKGDRLFIQVANDKTVNNYEGTVQDVEETQVKLAVSQSLIRK